MIFSYTFCMPDKYTFRMRPVIDLLSRYVKDHKIVVDPFSGMSTWGTITNDLNPNMPASYHMEAREFCDLMIKRKIRADVILFDPPYSNRQISESYKNVGRAITKEDTQNGRLYAEVRDRLVEIAKPESIAISFGWNSGGFGKKHGFDKIELMILNHGGAHNDTLVVVERRL